MDSTSNTSYGSWNCLDVFDRDHNLLEKIPAHDGDFFPENPLDHIEVLKTCIKNSYSKSWPVRVDIDITQKCTSNCFFCYSRKYSNLPLYRNAEIPEIKIDSLIKELAFKGTKSIRFTGGGEPLCHPEIIEILKLPRKYGLRSCLITNGDLLNKEISDSIVRNIDHVRISINASTDKTRELLHRSDSIANSISDIFQQIEYMMSNRKSNIRVPLVWMTFLLLPENIDDIYETADIAKGLKVDSISFRPVYHELSRQFSDNDIKHLSNQLQLAKKLEESPDFNVYIPKRNVNEVWYSIPSDEFSKCISCYTRTIIEATNKGPMVSICGLKRGHPDMRIGFINENFSLLWNSNVTKFKNIIKSCDHCIDISMNKTLNKLEKLFLSETDVTFEKSIL